MSDLITIRVKSKSGMVNDLQVSEIVEINGKPYRSAEDSENVTALVNHLSGRVAALEGIVGRMFSQGE